MSLKEKLKLDVRSKEKSQIDWAKRKEEWIASVNQLNELIMNGFADYKLEGLVDFKFSEKSSQKG
jgi:hypothetical protein